MTLTIPAGWREIIRTARDPADEVFVTGLPYWTIRDTGWNALLRAAFTLLLPMQCDGQAQPLRLTGRESGRRRQAPAPELPRLRLQYVPMGHRRFRTALQPEDVHRVRPAASRCCPPTRAPLQLQLDGPRDLHG